MTDEDFNLIAVVSTLRAALVRERDATTETVAVLRRRARVHDDCAQQLRSAAAVLETSSTEAS